MRSAALILAATLALGACNKADRQADALDHAATQADPVAADAMRNAADRIRDGHSDADLSDPNGPAQAAMTDAGAAAANSTAAPGDPATRDPMLSNGTDASSARAPGHTANRSALPHKAGDPVGKSVPVADGR